MPGLPRVKRYDLVPGINCSFEVWLERQRQRVSRVESRTKRQLLKQGSWVLTDRTSAQTRKIPLDTAPRRSQAPSPSRDFVSDEL